MKIRIAVAAIAIAVGLASSAQAQPQFFGFNDASYKEDTGANQTNVRALAVAAGANVQRIGISWKEVQPGGQFCSAGSINWGNIPAVVEAAVDAGMRPILNIMDAPEWAQGDLTCGLGSHGGAHVPPGNAYLPAWGTFVGAVMQRFRYFSPGVDLRPAAIEVWNEPNANYFWTDWSGPNPTKYADVFRYAANAVHQANDSLGTSVPVITGGLVSKTNPNQPNSERLSIVDFLTPIYPTLEFWMRGIDGLGLHPYADAHCMFDDEDHEPSCGALNRVTTALDDVRAVRDANETPPPGHQPRKIWATETGSTSGHPVNRDAFGNDQYVDMGVDRQCRLIMAIVDTIDPMTDVQALVIHSLLDRETFANDNNEEETGVVDLNELTSAMTPKPAYGALKLNRTGVGTACPAPPGP